jgi:hypothetical protein
MYFLSDSLKTRDDLGHLSTQQLVILKSNTAVGARDCSLLQNAQTVSGVQPTCCKMGIAVLSRGSTCRVVKLTIHLQLVSKLTMNGAITLLLIYAFMAWGEQQCLYQHNLFEDWRRVRSNGRYSEHRNALWCSIKARYILVNKAAIDSQEELCCV